MTILAKAKHSGLFVATMLAVGCSSSTPPDGALPPMPAPEAVVPPRFDAAIGISEVQARRELDLMFREAGLRILNDERLPSADIEVVLDGYDPARRIGYEYIADGEAAVSPKRDGLTALVSGDKILVVDACSLEALRHAASEFLAMALAQDAGV